jgi:hypothetical protein
MTTTAEFAFSKVSDASGSPPVVDLDEEERYDSEDQYVPSEEARPSMCFIIKY